MKTTTPYLTAEALGIEPWEREGLIALVGPLSRDELAIEMGYSFLVPSKHSCGSIGCIKGWMCARRGEKWCAHSEPLTELYYPTPVGWRANSLQAAQAIVNFLTLRDPRWDDVMVQPCG